MFIPQLQGCKPEVVAQVARASRLMRPDVSVKRESLDGEPHSIVFQHAFDRRQSGLRALERESTDLNLDLAETPERVGAPTVRRFSIFIFG